MGNQYGWGGNDNFNFGISNVGKTEMFFYDLEMGKQMAGK